MTSTTRKNAPRKIALLVASFSALTMLATPALADKKSYQDKTQAAGYIGKLSKKVIANGNLDRLAKNTKAKKLDRDSGHADADLRTRIQFWHTVALDIVALDHTPVEGGGSPVNQGGPTRTSRAMAMVQISVFEALNSLEGGFVEYTGRTGNGGNASPDSAVAQAAHDTLLALYPDQADFLADALAEDLALAKEGIPVWLFENGVRLGARASSKIFRDRDGDNSDISEPSFGDGGVVANGETTNFFGNPINGGTTDLGEWTPDPNTPEFAGDFNLSLGAFWGGVRPFVLDGADQFRAPAPALPGSATYAAAYNEVAGLGGAPDNANTPSTGTDATRFVGNYWGYDGVPLIGVPPRVYNQIAAQIASKKIQDPVRYARLLALVNVAMADAGIAAWDSKYFYNLWRPVTGIRIDDGDVNTAQDVDWNPVGVSVVNTEETIRPTPPFPAYPSGHAAFGASVFEVLRSMFGDNSPFTFISDEYNGEGVDPFFPDTPRPLVPVRFDSFTAAQLENGRSRVFNGVHWSFDDTAGQEIGVQVARQLLDNTDAFQPVNAKGNGKGKGKNNGKGKGKNNGNGNGNGKSKR